MDLVLPLCRFGQCADMLNLTRVTIEKLRTHLSVRFTFLLEPPIRDWGVRVGGGVSATRASAAPALLDLFD